MSMKETILKNIDVKYSFDFAKKMEKNYSNAQLGFRTAGSMAERATGELIREEMLKLGIPDVKKDKICVDGWEFKKAELFYTTSTGEEKKVILSAYQTNFVTEGKKPYQLVFVNKGTQSDYDGVDVAGKIALIKINQRDEWWINYPVYQAYIKGAAAVIAFQCGGYGEIDEEALNAQDIAGPADAAAFSLSVKDAEELIENLDDNDEISVRIDADTRVIENAETYNIVGTLKGKREDRIILLSAHYDSYFNGFQDDNTAIALLLGIASTLIKSKYQNECTIIFCAMAAEEWGVIDSQFDWSTGCYEEVFTVHPEWRGKVIADFNFELPALAHGTRARIRSTDEYAHFLDKFLQNLPESLTKAYPDRTTVVSPIETWSDDFTMAISGIPSMVNDFTGGNFMKNNYHSQFDNDEYYDEKVYRLHHELFCLLLLELDKTAVIPLDFSRTFDRAKNKLDDEFCRTNGFETEGILKKLDDAYDAALEVYQNTCAVNKKYQQLKKEDKPVRAKQLCESNKGTEHALLSLFRTAQDKFVKLNWYGEVMFPYEIVIERMEYIDDAIKNLKAGEINDALQDIYKMDNNAYAFRFEESVYRHFTDYVFKQSRKRLKWGYHRFVGHEDLLYIVKTLLNKRKEKNEDYSHEILLLEIVGKRQKRLLRETLDDLNDTLDEMTEELKNILK